MTSTIQQDLDPIFRAVLILSPGSYRFGEEAPVQVNTAAAATPLPGTPYHPLPSDPLVREMQSALYVRCYAHRLGGPATQPPQPDPQQPARLSAANHARERWDPGWRIYQVGENGQIFVLKGERQRGAMPGEYIGTGAPGMVPAVGSGVTLRVARESFDMQPGFYFMFSETLSDQWDDHSMLRFYFNCTPQGAVDLVDYLSRTLNGYQIPYRMKALTEAPQYTRTDSMVLYCARRYFRIVARLMESLPPEAAGGVDDPVPLFTKRLRAGVGLAEDPNTGESFGMHRCRLVAEGLVEAWSRGDQTPPGRFAAVSARFAANGLDLERPYLSPSRNDLVAPAEAAA